MSDPYGFSSSASQVMRLHRAFVEGDLDALRANVDDPDLFPNGPMPLAIGPCLVYAISHSPLSFIGTLLELGADPRVDPLDGFPPLIAAIGAGRVAPGAVARRDVPDLIRLLLRYGADPAQRGVNDYTALHMAVAEGDAVALDLLLEAGANPHERTRIDDYETPRELAESMGRADLARRLAEAESEHPPA